MSTVPAQRADVLPTDPTPRDFSRLGAIVTLARYGKDPQATWAPDDVAAQLWRSRRLLPFRDLAFMALNIAKDRRYKSPEAIYRTAATVAGVTSL